MEDSIIKDLYNYLVEKEKEAKNSPERMTDYIVQRSWENLAKREELRMSRD